ncbi:MAG: hypothetical protein ABIT76_05075 [Chthoniobacterales bacterium]
MKNPTIKASACVATLALFVTGCENLSPGANAALFGGLSGVGAGTIARSAGASTNESLAIGAATGIATAIVVYIVAKHQATERQHQIAEERARIAAARLERQRAAQASAKKKRKSRYIAVDTERNSESTGKKSVMIFDTESKEIVGNNVYDVQSTPAKGEVAKFDTYSAEYVGTGA